MDPQTKLVLDETKGLAKSVDLLKDTLNDRIDGVEDALGVRFEAVESTAASFGEWKPKVDAVVDDLRLEVGALRKQVHRVPA
ncbi:hypothetical protein ACP70R_008616 [Stipagrostis hirtigluma subsp. patula]